MKAVLAEEKVPFFSNPSSSLSWRLFEGALLQPFQMVPREHFYAAKLVRDAGFLSNVWSLISKVKNDLPIQDMLEQACPRCQRSLEEVDMKVDGNETKHCLIKKFLSLFLQPSSLVAKCKGGLPSVPSLSYVWRKESSHIHTFIHNQSPTGCSNYNQIQNY